MNRKGILIYVFLIMIICAGTEESGKSGKKKGLMSKATGWMKGGSSSTKGTNARESSHSKEPARTPSNAPSNAPSNTDDYTYTPYKSNDPWDQMRTHYPQATGPGSIFYQDERDPADENRTNIYRPVDQDIGYVDADAAGFVDELFRYPNPPRRD